jgi:hypothetical protein
MADRQLYKETFENRSIGLDMTTTYYTWHQYAAETSSFSVVAGKYGEIKVDSGTWCGGYVLTSPDLSTFADGTIEADIISYASGRFIIGFRLGASGGYWLQCLPGTPTESKIWNSGLDFVTGSALVDAQDPPSSVTSIKIVLSGTSIKIYYNGSSTPTHDIIDSAYLSGSIGVSGYQTGWIMDNLHVYDEYDTTKTNAQIIRKPHLIVNTSVTFKKNLGLTLDSAVDVTRYVKKLGDISEKLSKSAVSTGGVILPSLKIELDNSNKRWNENGKYFENGFVNGSEFTITTNYIDDSGNEVTPAFVYKGILKYSSCEWLRHKHFIFSAVLVPASSFLTTEVIKAGTIPAGTFTQVCKAILDRRPFNKYLTIDTSNFEFGWNISAIDRPSEMANIKVKTVLDELMLISGSVYYIDYDGNFIIEPIEPSSPTAICTLRGNDIYSINSEEYDWDSQYTAVKWNDNENEVQRVEMNYPTREQFQYDYRVLELTKKYVTDPDNRETIMENLLALNQFIKRKYTMVCKWNPEIIVNKYVSIDIPAEAIAGDQYLTWNESGDNWNDGLYWSIQQMGITFNSSDLWRVLNIKRSAEGEKMQIEIVQQNSDNES